MSVADMLATPADVANLLQIPLDAFNAETAILLLEAGTAVVQAFTGQDLLLKVDDVEEIDLDEYDYGRYLYLRQRPVVSVAEVKIGATVITEYTPQLSRGRLWRHCAWRSEMVRWLDHPSTATVKYTHGYAAGAQDLQLARGVTLALIGSVYSNPSGASSLRIDDYAATYAAMERTLLAQDTLMQLLRKKYAVRPRSARLVRG
jgi:hypothetical protein